MFSFFGKQDKIVQRDVNIGKGHVCVGTFMKVVIFFRVYREL